MNPRSGFRSGKTGAGNCSESGKHPPGRRVTSDPRRWRQGVRTTLEYGRPSGWNLSTLGRCAIHFIRASLRTASLATGIAIVLLATIALRPATIRFFDAWQFGSHWRGVTIWRFVSCHVENGQAHLWIRAERSEDMNGQPIRTPRRLDRRSNLRGVGTLPYRIVTPPLPIIDTCGVRYESYLSHRDPGWADTSIHLSLRPMPLYLFAFVAFAPAIWKVGRKKLPKQFE
jgi:hypothetical protein